MQFWRNPEFVRLSRAEMRAPRAITMAVLALVVCALVGLSCWGAVDESKDFFHLFHVWLVGIQFTVLGFWCATACGHAISRERELKTFDFLRTTRLTAMELAVGKVFGAPIMAYFVVACTLPLSVGSGLLGGISPATLVGVYVLLVAFALFVSILSLWVSMLLEKSNSGLAVIVTLLPIGFGYTFTYSPFSGFSALSIFPALFDFYNVRTGGQQFPPTVVGIEVPYLLLTLFLYGAFGAWFVLMLVRNLKKEREEMNLITGWQAIGFVAFLNILYYLFLDPKKLTMAFSSGSFRSQDAAGVALSVNTMLLYMLGLALIGSREKLKVWWRNMQAGHESFLARNGLVWPWLLIGALVAYAFLAAEALGLQRAVPVSSWRLGISAVIFFDLVVFVVRDITFLQWCTLTRMKRPLLKGFLYLWLYYVAVGIVTSVVGLASQSASALVAGLLTPWQIFGLESVGLASAHPSYVGMALQIAVTFLLITTTTRRLGRAPTVPIEASA